MRIFQPYGALHILVTSWSGVWRQADGTLLSWSPWWAAPKDEQGEPNHGTAENCAYVHLDEGTFAGQWWNAPCSAAVHYVCERGFWIKYFQTRMQPAKYTLKSEHFFRCMSEVYLGWLHPLAAWFRRYWHNNWPVNLFWKSSRRFFISNTVSIKQWLRNPSHINQISLYIRQKMAIELYAAHKV